MGVNIEGMGFYGGWGSEWDGGTAHGLDATDFSGLLSGCQCATTLGIGAESWERRLGNNVGTCDLRRSLLAGRSGSCWQLRITNEGPGRF